MKKVAGLLFLVLATNMLSQETEVGRDTSNKIIPHPVWTPDPADPLVAKYEYQKKAPKDNIISKTEADTTFDLKSSFKFPLTALLANKIGFAYERVFKYKFSWELQPMYIFANPVYDGASQSLWPNISFKNSGVEVRFGLNLLTVKPYRAESKKLHSKGLFISYRYQHAGNVDFSTDGKGGQGYYYNYRVSQTKNVVGIFYRNRTFTYGKSLGSEFFYEFGFYTGIARTVCFEYAGAYGDDIGAPMDVKSVGMPMENGFVFVPVLRLGMTLRYNRLRMP